MINASDLLGSRILIVDDQDANLRMLQRLLGEAGYLKVSATNRPTEVCALHRQHDYDLILLDLQMPGMDGFQVIDGLKTNSTDPYLPVIVLTAQPGHKLRALQAGAKDFISKPLDLAEVLTRIHNMLEVRWLYRQLAQHARQLEAAVQERTAELRESEARFRSLTELASDWYWEQDESGAFTKVSGPVLEMLGIQVDALDDAGAPAAGDAEHAGWNEPERAALRARIAAREPFLDFAFSRQPPGGKRQQYRVSGQPMFDSTCRFIGYRGIGLEVLTEGA
jgi:PAS domain S-box-containing protein